MAALRKEAQASIKTDLVLDIAGSDIDARMIEIAKKNAFAAGVEQDIVFKQMRVQDCVQIKLMVSSFLIHLTENVCWMMKPLLPCIEKWGRLLNHSKHGLSLF